MTLEDLRILVAVCESGNLSALARDLGRTQSSISQHITRLENELGMTLFERHTRGVAPTSAGLLLKDFALEGLDAIEIGVQRVRALAHGDVGTLTVTTGSTTVRHFMRAAIVRFRKEHPGVKLRFLPANSTKRCFEILRLSQADLAFVTMGVVSRGIAERPVVSQQLFLLVSKRSAFAKQERVQVRDLREIRYLGLAEGTTHHSTIEQAALARGIRLQAEVIVDDFDTAKIFVELDLGEAIVPAMHAHNFTNNSSVKAILIADLPPISVGWAFRNWKYLTPAARAFIASVETELKKLDDVRGFELLKAR